MKKRGNAKLLEFILTELNNNGVNVKKGRGLSPFTSIVGSRRKKLHIKYPNEKDF